MRLQRCGTCCALTRLTVRYINEQEKLLPWQQYPPTSSTIMKIKENTKCKYIVEYIQHELIFDLDEYLGWYLSCGVMRRVALPQILCLRLILLSGNTRFSTAEQHPIILTVRTPSRNSLEQRNTQESEMVGGVLFEKSVSSDNRVVVTSSHPFHGLNNESGDKKQILGMGWGF